MSDELKWLAMLGLGLSTFLTRNFFMLFGKKIKLNQTAQQALRYAPSCALVAIVFPAILYHQEKFVMSWYHPQLFSAVVTIMIYTWRKDMLSAMLLGILSFMLLKQIG